MRQLAVMLLLLAPTFAPAQSLADRLAALEANTARLNGLYEKVTALEMKVDQINAGLVDLNLKLSEAKHEGRGLGGGSTWGAVRPGDGTVVGNGALNLSWNATAQRYEGPVQTDDSGRWRYVQYAAPAAQPPMMMQPPMMAPPMMMMGRMGRGGMMAGNCAGGT